MEINLGSCHICGLALSPDYMVDGLGFIATDQTLLISRNGGNTWQDALKVTRAGKSVPVLSVLFSNRIGERQVLAGVSGGVLRSTDDGETWQVITFSSPLPLVTALVESANTLFAGTAQDGVLLSNDGGLTWERWNFGLLDGNIYALSVVQWADGNTEVFVGTETGIFSSVNNGRSWRETNFPIEMAPVLSLCSLAPQAGSDPCGWLFAGTEAGNLFRSSDQGRTWEATGQGNFGAEISALATFDGNLYAASGDKVCISSDNGTVWRRWDAPAVVSGVFTCLASLQNGLLLAGTSGGQVFQII
ncbi:MAG: hypothetical protein PHQ40_12020 [Anaerolineaceae bacterium]|nr:hypothetical protein [Anaerolineaceae bacterium]